MENTDVKIMEETKEVKTKAVKKPMVKKEEKIEEKELTPQEQLDQLKNFRTNGSITLDITYKDFKYIRNVFRSKTPWEGPNEAYLLCVLNLNLEQALSKMNEKTTESQKVDVLNGSIEAMSIFINKIGGSNAASAQNNLSMLMTLNQAISQLQTIDKQIKKLNSEVLERELPKEDEKVKK